MSSAYETEIYESFMYPGPEPRVPRNLLNIQDWDDLNEAEAAFVSVQIETLPAAAMELTYQGYKAIHRHLFRDIYEWAGEERSYTTGRNKEAPFAKPEYIAGWMEKLFRDLQRDNFLRDLDRDNFSHKAGAFINEVNAAHPFMEGNGRVQRLFLQILAEQAGYDLKLDRTDAENWNEASRIGFLTADNRMMAELIRNNLTRLPTIGP